MTHAMYWVEFDGDRTGLDIAVNGIPVDRLMRSHGGRLPINEFLRPGDNSVTLRRGLWSSSKPDDEGGHASLKLVLARFQNATKLDEQVLLEQTGTFSACPPQSVLVEGSFGVEYAPAPPPLDGFDPIGPVEQARILDQLERVAGLWRTGDGNGLIGWMSHYLDDYVQAYALETRAAMEGRIRHMAEAFRSAKTGFDQSTVRLVPLPGTNMVDCLGPLGAAVRVARESGPDYDMWAVVGMKDGRAVLVR